MKYSVKVNVHALENLSVGEHIPSGSLTGSMHVSGSVTVETGIVSVPVLGLVLDVKADNTLSPDDIKTAIRTKCNLPNTVVSESLLAGFVAISGSTPVEVRNLAYFATLPLQPTSSIMITGSGK